MAATALERRVRRPAVQRPGFSADDERLVTRVRDGDDTAFEAIYDRYAAGLLAFCRHMLTSRDDAEDALQHSLAAAYRMLRASDREVELRPWLYTIARNRCLSVLRARRKDISLEAAPEPRSIADEVVDLVQRRSDLRDLVEDLRQLPGDQRAALVMFELGGLPHDEIATVLDVRRDKVKALVFQAREGLIRARHARETPCIEMRRQLATVAGGIPKRGTLRRHVDRCPSCALFEAEVGRQRAGLALILPVAPTLGLKAMVLSSVFSRGGAIAGGGAGAGGGAAVLGAGGGGAVACAGAGSGAAGLAGAGAGVGAGAGAAAGSASILAGATGGTVGGALATAGGAGTVAAALGAKGATVAVAKLLTVAAVVVGGGAATQGDLSQYAPAGGTVPVERQAAAPPAAPSAAVQQLLGPATPAPAAAPPVLAAGGATPAAGQDPLLVGAADPALKPVAASLPMAAPAAPVGPVGPAPAAPDSASHATGGSQPGPSPAPAPAGSQPPATAPPATSGTGQTATPGPTTTTTTSTTTTVGVTTTADAPAGSAPGTHGGTSGTVPPTVTTPVAAVPADPAGPTATPTDVVITVPQTGTPDTAGAPPTTQDPSTVHPPAPVAGAEPPVTAP
jgi:RNA polymerase sigma factor (sigma-70 family)